MGLKAFGFTLDVALLGVAAYLFSTNPLIKDVYSHGLAAVARLPYGGGASASAYNGTSHFASPAANAWYDFIAGDNLGVYSSPELHEFHEWDAWLNSLLLPARVCVALPHMAAVWLRNLLAGWALYYAVGGLWAVWIYWIFGAHYFPDASEMPSWDSMFIQMRVSSSAMVMYTFMPTLGEWLMERGLSRAYMTIPSGWAGLASYLAGSAAYLLMVEWGVYWCHRYLHDNHALYLLLHKPHHIYNNKHSLSPFAGLAFHPVDGMIQASPYVVFLCAMPVHFWTHLGMLFFTAIWTANIHDTIKVNSEPVMGAGYHTLHHTLYKDNYGQFFVFFDWIHDTLTPPRDASPSSLEKTSSGAKKATTRVAAAAKKSS